MVGGAPSGFQGAPALSRDEGFYFVGRGKARTRTATWERPGRARDALRLVLVAAFRVEGRE